MLDSWSHVCGSLGVHCPLVHEHPGVVWHTSEFTQSQRQNGLGRLTHVSESQMHNSEATHGSSLVIAEHTICVQGSHVSVLLAHMPAINEQYVESHVSGVAVSQLNGGQAIGPHVAVSWL